MRLEFEYHGRYLFCFYVLILKKKRKLADNKYKIVTDKTHLQWHDGFRT
jgi:hypothetical protein